MFKLHSEYKPTGDQPKAIEYLSKGIEKVRNSRRFLVLQVLEKHSQWQISFKKYKNQHLF